MENVRLSYFHNGSSIEVLEENNYYPFGLKHEGYNGLAGNPSYQYKYNGKELQETGMYDYGARFYMPDIGRWGVVDPLAEKYTRMSPYTYVGNNPSMFVDYDGRDFGMYIDFKTGTITIKAHYYTTKDGFKSANQATEKWNNTSNKYTYNYDNGAGQTVKMKIKFDLTTSIVDEGENRIIALNNAVTNGTSGESNSYRLLSDEKMDSNENGSTYRTDITVRRSHELNDETGPHEIGHSLGSAHTKYGLLTSATNSEGRSSDLPLEAITNILGTIQGTKEEPSKAKVSKSALGQATIHILNNKLQDDKDYKKFRNGKVIPVESEN